MEEKRATLVFLPIPGISHLVSMVELAKQFLLHHNRNFSITVLSIPPLEPSPQLSSYVSSVVDSGLDIIFHNLPKMDPSLFANANGGPGTFIPTISRFYKPIVKSSVEDLENSSSSTTVTAIIVDMFFVDMVDVANEIDIPCYVFFTSSATFLGFLLYLPTLDASLPADKDMEELEDEGITRICLPCLSAADMPTMALAQLLSQRKNKNRAWLVGIAQRFHELKGVIVNTFLELQPYCVKCLEDGHCLPNHPTPAVYPVGPLLSFNTATTPASSSSSSDGPKHECIQWLDGQPSKSVVFLCFGSRGSLSTDQAREVAAGLEQAGHRFLWVLRSPAPPDKTGVSPSAMPGPVNAVLDEVLPKGFLERTKDRGMVWPTFAPQSDILGHMAVGGFVTHCGWNSCLESLWFGVPMLPWPLHAEQHLNALDMVEEMEVAVDLKVDVKAGNWVSAEEIERGIRCLMEEGCCEQNKKVRSKVEEMKVKGRRALGEGGSSFHCMERLVEMLVPNISHI